MGEQELKLCLSQHSTNGCSFSCRENDEQGSSSNDQKQKCTFTGSSGEVVSNKHVFLYNYYKWLTYKIIIIILCN